MAWVRIHDGALSHPKLVGLIDWRSPFCLWVWGLSYCQTHLTNGRIPRAALPNAAAIKTAVRLVNELLWEIDGTTFVVHDYLDWNDSRELVTKKRTEAKERMQNARDRSSREHLENFARTSTSMLGKSGSFPEKGSGEKPAIRAVPVPVVDDLALLQDRAARFCDRFGELFQELRRGAKYLPKPSLDWQKACDLARVWDDARLEKLARIFLTTDDTWISGTGRGLQVFAAKASWCDDRLKAWELEHGDVA